MKGLIQRVKRASVHVEKVLIAEIPAGLLLFLGVEKSDGQAQVSALLKKVVNYRVFPDQDGRMNRSLMDAGGSLLIVPQFTLAADTGSGTRPGFSGAAAPDDARALFCNFLQQSTSLLGPKRIGAGQFGADMEVSLVNDGPVTFLLEVSGFHGSNLHGPK
ncbi:D-aminoacyl-tRNA deacylase [Marinobacter caseinilyticus]|uniref:D-aminoacyl-tRNA deacylase n=1 Tax=Marinobacter caseinilyticus TaxID=2692195 RepID=UPI00140B3E26|nr:D-aminoacyl-tRNA deacylase [Marinobacter caseinilyticus]